jgi:hypothetical protein
MTSKLCCNKSNYKTNQTNNLYTHINSVHGYTCPNYDCTVLFQRDLQGHIISTQQQKSLICSQCNNIASNYELLLLHLKEQHNKINY